MDIYPYDPDLVCDNCGEEGSYPVDDYALCPMCLDEYKMEESGMLFDDYDLEEDV